MNMIEIRDLTGVRELLLFYEYSFKKIYLCISKTKLQVFVNIMT
jgi:hypothetical protein